jgi:hypothetical protein
MEEVLPNFDWVTARSECSVATVFGSLAAGVQSDVETMERITRTARQPLRFEYSREGTRIVVSRSGNPPTFVYFVLDNSEIRVEVKDEVRLRALPGLTAAGECLVRIGDKDLHLWQFRKMALEGLFFGTI